MEPEEIRQRSFPVRDQGFDQDSVRAFLRELADELQSMRASSGQGSLNLSRGVAEQTSKILAAAEDAVEEIKAGARKDGEAVVASMRAEASEIIARARTEAAEIVAGARTDAAGVKREFEFENRKVEDDIRRLKEARTILATQLEDVGRRLEEMMMRLRNQVDDWPGQRSHERPGERRTPDFERPPTGGAPDSPTRERDSRARSSSPPGPGGAVSAPRETALAERPPRPQLPEPNGLHGSQLSMPPAAPAIPEQAAETVTAHHPGVIAEAAPPVKAPPAVPPPAAAGTPAAPGPSEDRTTSPSAANAAAPVDAPEQAAAPSASGAPSDAPPAIAATPETAPSREDAASQDTVSMPVTASGGGAPAPAGPTAAEEPAAPSPPDAEVRDPLARRASELGDIPGRAAGRLKRLLQEDQNVMLDRIRRMRAGGDFSHEIAPVQEQSARYEGGMREPLEFAFAAGRRAAGTDSSESGAGDIVTMLVQKQLVSPLRRDLSKVMAAGQQTEESSMQLAERCNEVYRIWKGVRAELLGEGLVYSAYHHGLAGGWKESGTARKRWVLSPEEQSCPKDVCRTNASAGVFAVEGYFPSGHLVPPAHGACDCTLEAG